MRCMPRHMNGDPFRTCHGCRPPAATHHRARWGGGLSTPGLSLSGDGCALHLLVGQGGPRLHKPRGAPASMVMSAQEYCTAPNPHNRMWRIGGVSAPCTGVISRTISLFSPRETLPRSLRAPYVATANFGPICGPTFDWACGASTSRGSILMRPALPRTTPSSETMPKQKCCRERPHVGATG